MLLKRNRIVLLIVFLALVCSNIFADTQAFTIVDDPALNTAIADARAQFLASKPYITRLDATILIPDTNGTWRRGSYNPDAIAYPASCVKLAYLASAMYWCRTNNHPYDYLDWCVRPMIEHSDNVATGDTVDQITGAPNYDTTVQDATFNEWYAKRLYTENFLASKGLLENQTILHKTYPTNSGSSPTGAEQLAQTIRGGNRMQAKCSASLMLEIIKGAIEPDANAYMRELLTHARFGMDSEFGFGLPPGCIYENKLGLAYDTLEDIAYVKMPGSNQEFILAAFSNGFVAPETSNPYPYDASVLGVFAEMVIDRLNLSAGCPSKIKIDNDAAECVKTGTWTVETDKVTNYDMHGNSFLYTLSTRTATATVTWNLLAPETGLYEVCVWNPQKSTASTVTYTINHAGGATNVSVDQTVNGGRWVYLGDFQFNVGQGTVVLNNIAARTNKTVMADAIKITKWPADALPDFIVDNDQGSPAYNETGGWSTSTSSGYNNSTYRFAAIAAPNTATWTQSLPQNGTYDVFVYYRASTNRATNTKYDISTAAGTQTVYINQTTNDMKWVKIGTFNMNAGNNTITLDALGSTSVLSTDVVIADAVAWDLVSGTNPTPTPTPAPTATPTPIPTATPTPTPVPQIPAAPTNLTAAVISKSQINLAWTDNANNEDNIVVERKKSSDTTYSVIATLPANTTSYNNTGLTRNTTYNYRVKATNAAGSSAYSNVVTATTLNK